MSTPTFTITGHIIRIDCSDRYVYRRGEQRRKIGPISRIHIQQVPQESKEVEISDDHHERDYVPDPLEYDVPREMAEALRIGQEVRIEIRAVER